MASPLIATKLHVPSRRPATVSRPRLTNRLTGQAQLTLIAAPAGFGKTTVLTEWLTTLGVDSRVAWVSLDERDNDNDLFWRYVVSALDKAEPGVGTAALKLLASPSAPLEATVATLINDLDAAATQIVLVLDDYHVIENAAVHTGMDLLLRSLPANIRLILASRADPALPLARLRSRGELIELRAGDLRFRREESAEYLTEVMGVHLRDDDVETLGDRTEGWIAAIQLAALSMQGREDPADFIAGFAGDDRYVVDYLVEEVLERQPEAVRRFLLETSILSVLTGDLCDAVTGESSGSDTLEALERANLFVIPLDDHRESYRYHHLFAEMLRARLLNELPERVGELHLRASKWFERHGQTTEAIGHAIEGGSFDRAAEMIAAAMPVMQQNRQETTLVRWYEMLPAEIVRTHPALSIGFAGSLMSAGMTDGVDALLLDAEAAIGDTSDGIRAVRSGVALYRAAQALVRCDLETAYEQASVAVVLSQDGGHIDRGSSNGILGLVQWSKGDLSAARAAWTISLNELLLAGHRSDVLGGSLAMADILIAQGHLGDARDTYRRGLDLAATTEPQLRGAADMHVGMCDLLRERGDLEGAHRHLAAAETLGEYAGLPQNRHRRRIAAALLLHSEGDPAAAISVFDEAEQVYTPDFFPDVRPIPALRARAMLAAGDNAGARDWADRSGLTVDDTLTYLREFEHITFARVLLSGPPDARRVRDANALLERLLAAAADGDRAGCVLEILILRALALHLADHRDAALHSLRDAVDRAEPEGYLRAFADEGEPMARLLAALAKRDGWNAHLRTLHTAASGQRPHRSTSQGLIDPLSDRELDVLRLLGSELGGPEISRELVVSLNTLRTHTKNIYSKLGVTSRREAVRRAAELGILRAR